MNNRWYIKVLTANPLTHIQCWSNHWLWLLVGLVGCELTADNVKVPETKPKLVVSSFISPQDTLLTVLVSKSTPIYGTSTSTPEVTDATVVMSDGSASTNLTYTRQGKYTALARSLPIKPGQTYFLTVSTPDGLQVKASCMVPLRANDAITSILLDSVVTEQVPGYAYKEYRLSVEWQDAPGEGDYYRVFAERPFQQQSGLDPANPSKVDTLYSQIFFERNEEYAQDAGQDGRTFIARNGSFQANDDPNTPDQFKVKREINVLLLTTDQGYYRYQLGLANSANVDNPFAEPTLLYSNVEGGLGVFAAFQQVKRVFRY